MRSRLGRAVESDVFFVGVLPRWGCAKKLELELVVVQAHMAQKPLLRKAPHGSGICWKQLVMCLEGTWFVAANRGIHLGYVGAIHCCKAPLWGRRLDLDSPKNTVVCAPAPLTALARRREEEVAGRS